MYCMCMYPLKAGCVRKYQNSHSTGRGAVWCVVRLARPDSAVAVPAPLCRYGNGHS